MSTDTLSFKTMAGAVIRFDFKKCDDCETKACIEADHLPFLGPVLELKNGRPSLIHSEDEIKRGKCTDCVACELECQLRGNGGVSITYEIPKLDEYLGELEEEGLQTVYQG